MEGYECQILKKGCPVGNILGYAPPFTILKDATANVVLHTPEMVICSVHVAMIARFLKKRNVFAGNVMFTSSLVSKGISFVGVM